MTYQGLGEMFEGDSANVHGKVSARGDGGPSGGSSMRRPGARTPFSERKFIYVMTHDIKILHKSIWLNVQPLVFKMKLALTAHRKPLKNACTQLLLFNT